MWLHGLRELVKLLQGMKGEKVINYNIGERKLSAIYQFAKAMPLLFVPVAHNKGGENK